MVVVISHLADHLNNALADVRLRGLLKTKGPSLIQEMFEILKPPSMTEEIGLYIDFQAKIVRVLEQLVGSNSSDPS